MSKIDNGGAAYPVITWENPQGFAIGSMEHGLTKREAFAMAAMQGMGTWVPYVPKPNTDYSDCDLGSQAVLKARSEWAVRQADALLAALRGDA
jgi:hypothetical protein